MQHATCNAERRADLSIWSRAPANRQLSQNARSTASKPIIDQPCCLDRSSLQLQDFRAATYHVSHLDGDQGASTVALPAMAVFSRQPHSQPLHCQTIEMKQQQEK